MGRAEEIFNNVSIKSGPGCEPLSSERAEELRHIFWNLMDTDMQGYATGYLYFMLNAWGRRCFLIQLSQRTDKISRYEIMNCSYEQLQDKIVYQYDPLPEGL